MIMSIIENGYRIYFTCAPPPMNNKNNSSALLNTDFVRITILQLLSSGRIIEKSQPSYVNSPLSVVTQATGKKRLILD